MTSLSLEAPITRPQRSPVGDRPEVAFAWVDDHRHVVDGAGRPLIPVATAAELSALQHVADLHGVRLLAADAEPGVATPSRSGGVAAFGDAAAASAALYAHLSGRPFLGVVPLGDLGREPLGVVVTTTPQLSYDLMSRLYHNGARPSAAPGLLLGRDADDLWLIVKRSALALACSGLGKGRRTLVFPAADFHKVSRPEGLFIGGLARNDEVVDALSAGPGVLFLHTHSTGFDLRLGPKLQVCPLDPREPTQAALRPPCLDSGRCTQLADLPPRETAWRDGRLVATAAIRACVLVLIACSAVRLRDDLLDPVFNMGAALSRQATAGAILATWRGFEAISPEGFELYELLDRIADGEAMGVELERFHRLQGSVAPPVGLCLLGDPDYQLAPASFAPLTARPPARPPTPDRAALSRDLGRLEISRRLVRDFLDVAPCAASDQERLDALFTEQGRALLAARSATPSAALRELNKRIAQRLLDADFVFERLIPYTTSDGATSLRACPTCGQPARERRLQFHVEVPDWRATFCDTCATSEMCEADLPSAVGFRSDGDGAFRLLRHAPDAEAAVQYFNAFYPALVAVPEHFRQAFWWPRDEAGRLLSHFRAPDTLPSGPLRCKVFLVQGGTFETYTTRLRAHRPAPRG